MQFIRSLIFNIFLYFGLVAIFIFAIPTLILPSKYTIFFGRLSAKYIVLILRLILNTKLIFHGLDNLRKYHCAQQQKPRWLRDVGGRSLG